jgi:hypothetical protein
MAHTEMRLLVNKLEKQIQTENGSTALKSISVPTKLVLRRDHTLDILQQLSSNLKTAETLTAQMGFMLREVHEVMPKKRR